MDASFLSVEDAPLVVGRKQHLVLLRAPKDFDFSSLNGRKVDLNSNAAQEVGQNATLSVDRTGVSRDIRAVIHSDVDGGAKISSAFRWSLAIQQKYTTPRHINADESLDLQTLPVRPAYEHIEQVDFLQLRALPIGSSSSLQDVRQRQKAAPGVVTSGEKKSKKGSKTSHKSPEGAAVKKKKRKSTDADLRTVSPADVVKTEATVAVESSKKRVKRERRQT